MIYTVRTDEKMSYTLCEEDTVKSVLQNCHLILVTSVGSVPMYRKFGTDTDFLDRPMTVVQVMMIPKVKEALEMFEPRAEFVRLTCENSIDEPGKITVILEVEINEQSL